MTLLQRFVFISFLFVLFQVNTISATGPYAEIVSIQHSCDNEGGSIEIELLGEGPYTYYWSNGAEGLILTDLEPGIYIFTIMDIFGCEEVYEVEIKNLNACEIKYSIEFDDKKCTVTISIAVSNSVTGEQIDEDELVITWVDGNPAGLTRVVVEDGNYCVKIEGNQSVKGCCEIEECFFIYQLKGCVSTVPPGGGSETGKVKKVIVNEFDKGLGGANQFIELLVIGDGICGNMFDLRGYHIDDNNGDLIPANEFVGLYSLGGIGINPGFLTFSDVTSWSQIPNGSLIVIYVNVESTSDAGFPDLDELDSNYDGVYVLQANNSNFFTAQTGEWDQQLKIQAYSGETVLPNETFLSIDTPADGVQVRNPDGSYCHGLSSGKSAYSSYNEFSLWLTAQNGVDNCQFIGSDYTSKYDFAYSAHYDSLKSPGTANSSINEIFIAKLIQCEEKNNKFEGLSQNIDQNGSNESEQNNFFARPNPFSGELIIDVISSEDGNAVLFVYNNIGDQIIQKKLTIKDRSDNISLTSLHSLPSGIYYIQILFPDGERKSSKVSHIR